MDLEQRIAERLDASDFDGAATIVIREYGPRIIGYLRSMLRDDSDVADAFSLFAEAVWRGMAGFERRSAALTWAFRAGWSAALKVKDDAYRRRHARLDTSEAERLAESVRTKTAVRQERQRAELEELRAELSQADQSLLALRLDHQLGWAEIAEVMTQEGAPVDEAALRKRYERIKARLKVLLEKHRAARGEGGER